MKATHVMLEVRTGDITNEVRQRLRFDFQLCSCSGRYSIKERREAESFLSHITFSLPGRRRKSTYIDDCYHNVVVSHC
jgi:hypothetical protein